MLFMKYLVTWEIGYALALIILHIYTYIEQAPGVGDGQGSWRAAVHGITKSWAWLSDWNDWLDTYIENMYEIAYQWKCI